MLRHHTKFQCSTMPGTGLKVCVGAVGGCGGWVRWGGCKPILVFSFDQAEQNVFPPVMVGFILLNIFYFFTGVP